MTTLLALAALSAFAGGGTEVSLGQSTYVASIRKTETGQTECEATLIARKYLDWYGISRNVGVWSGKHAPSAEVRTTSVYCADSSLNYASIGSRYSSGDKDGERFKIVKKTVHPQYNEETLDYDFAILELETESKFPPAALNWDEDAVTEPGTVSWVRGFGAPAIVDEISGLIAFVRQNSPVLLQAEATT
ncbi:hypothetical protein H310_02630 [Aphanomyces invadans]|uniref:Peptidase S1 domain-containing protein n=1 Tax=Aphanomyces invadans TaxID=157072 RepID=A0A024UJJ4_9STRA|nr:hypothetical protein H310_02630 [Aphanomyces invadans]ETW06350.1 hypothetical protein H310_02630 [Aphanomyces invadans]|eukprot:XP_008864425.1 hypothetical protein H310_02630 [Aphanomyces invadans]